MEFVGKDIHVCEKLHTKYHQKYVKEEKIFTRNIDLWMLSFCIAMKKNLEPLPINKGDDTKKAILSDIWASSNNRNFEPLIKLACLAKLDTETLMKPHQFVDYANEMANAGYKEIEKIITSGDDEEDDITNLLYGLKDIIES